jgi:hypothetical protein
MTRDVQSAFPRIVFDPLLDAVSNREKGTKYNNGGSLLISFFSFHL